LEADRRQLEVVHFHGITLRYRRAGAVRSRMGHPQSKLYLMGLPSFTLVIDHQALVSILDNYTLDAIEIKNFKD
jgi:hypothetical protein